MISYGINESIIVALAWLGEFGYVICQEPQIVTGSGESWKAKEANAFPEMTEPALHNKAGSEFLLPQLVDEQDELYC